MTWEQRLPRGRMRDSRVRVLLAVIDLHRRNGSVRLSDVMAATGKSRATVWKHLDRLWVDGLVDWVEGKHATLRPTVIAVPIGC